MYPLLPLLLFQLCFHGLIALLKLSFFLYIFGYILFWQLTGKFKRGKVGSDWHQDPEEAGCEPTSPGISRYYPCPKGKEVRSTNAKENKGSQSSQSSVILLKLEPLTAHIKDVLMSYMICWFIFIWPSAEMITKWLKINW